MISEPVSTGWHFKKKQSMCKVQDCEMRVFDRQSGLCYFHFKHTGHVNDKQQKPIKPISKTQKSKLQVYKPKRKQYLKEHPYCEAKLKGCKKVASQIHHRKGRVGELLNDETHWLAVCESCHIIIETNPAMAKERGLSESRIKK